MVWFRLIGALILAGVAGCGIAYLLSGKPVYLRYAGQLFVLGVIVGFIFFGLMIVERLF